MYTAYADIVWYWFKDRNKEEMPVFEYFVYVQG